MAKTKVRLASVEDYSVKVAIDRGAEIDKSVKDLSMQGLAYREVVKEAARNEMQDGETSVRLAGDKANALVVVKKKFDLDPKAETYEAAVKAVEDGVIAGKVKETVTVDKDQVEEVRKVLQEAGLEDALTVQVKVSLDNAKWQVVKETTLDANGEAAKEAVKASLNVKETVTVKYENENK